jgi:hypothetical protein
MLFLKAMHTINLAADLVVNIIVDRLAALATMGKSGILTRLLVEVSVKVSERVV